MHSPARAAALRRMPRRQSGVPGMVLGLVVLVVVVFAAAFLGKVERADHSAVSTQPAVSVPVASNKPVHLVFEPPQVHNDLQDANQKMVVDIINDPSSWGLKDKAPIKELTGNVLQVYLSTLETDNHFYHYNSNGDVQLSYSGCCAGIGQVYTLTSVCEGWELKDIRRNAWCSARIFADYYNEYRVKAPENAFELTAARYKGAVLLDDEGFMELSNGLPIIPGDPNDPESPISQVNRVFIDPDTGKSMFRFVTD